MTPIETGQSEYEHPLDDRAVVVPAPSNAAAEVMQLAEHRDKFRAVLSRARATLAEGVATADSTTARGGPLALCQAARLALKEIDESGVLA